MEAVNTIEGIIYGFKHIMYGIGVVIIGLIFAGIGVAFMANGPGAGGVAGAMIFFLIGASIILAGMFGVTYKVIADAVATGNHRVQQTQQSTTQQSQKVATKVDED